MQTLAAKCSFEAYAATHGVKIRQYHAGNERFAEKLFLNHFELSGLNKTPRVVSVPTPRMALLKDESMTCQKGPEH
jgi:vacuolar-type H+-ATPase subunit B/Vma2